jgi:hypothetical protein
MRVESESVAMRIAASGMECVDAAQGCTESARTGCAMCRYAARVI